MSTERDIAQVKDILKEVRGDGTRSIEDQLKDLFDKFNLAARAIDSSIEGTWVGYDEGGNGRFRRPVSIVFEREGSPFFRRRS